MSKTHGTISRGSMMINCHSFFDGTAPEEKPKATEDTPCPEQTPNAALDNDYHSHLR